MIFWLMMRKNRKKEVQVNGNNAMMIYGYILDPKERSGEGYPSETFRILKDKEIAEFGEHRTQGLVLEACDRER